MKDKVNEEIFIARAEILSANNLEKKKQIGDEVIIFKVESRMYAIKSDCIFKVSQFNEVTGIPTAPREIFGVIYFSGAIWPVIHTAYMLHQTDHNAYKNIIFLKVHNNFFTLLIDEILDQDVVDEVDINHKKLFCNEQLDSLTVGTVKNEIVLLDPVMIFNFIQKRI